MRRSARSTATAASRTTRRKATWQPTSAHRFDVSFFGDPANGDERAAAHIIAPGQTTSGYSSLDFGGHNQTVHYDGVLSSHFLVDASFGRALNRILETPAVNEWQVTDFRVTPRVDLRRPWVLRGRQPQRQLADPGEGDEHPRRRLASIRCATASTSSIWTSASCSSSPVRRSRRRTASRTATGAVVDIIPDPVFGQIYHVSRASLTAARPTTQHYAAFFVEDEWKIGNSLTIRPGVRYEQETLSGTLMQEFSLKNNWAPRVGVVWDPTEERQRTGVRELRPLLRSGAERSCGARAVV